MSDAPDATDPDPSAGHGTHRQLRVDGDRLWRTLHELAEIGATPAGGVARVALTDLDKAGRDRFVEWVSELGCSVHLDRMGNIFARYEGTAPGRAPVVVGSHLDSQPTGGKFDGAYGVMVGLEILRVLHDSGTRLNAPIEVVSWTNEEGARFPPAMIGSGVFGGAFSLEEGLGATAFDGTRLGDELLRIGYSGPEPCGDRPIGHYLEPHIEQGPVLEAGGDVVGVVTGVQGIRWYDVSIEGRESHAGTTPMDRRRDAMVSAARLVTAVDDIARRRDPEGRSTVGVLTSTPASRNTVAGHVQLTIDLRHPDAAELERMHEEVLAAAAALEPAPTVEQIWYSPPWRQVTAPSTSHRGLATTPATWPGSRRPGWCSSPARTACRTTKPRASPPSTPQPAPTSHCGRSSSWRNSLGR